MRCYVKCKIDQFARLEYRSDARYKSDARVWDAVCKTNHV